MGILNFKTITGYKTSLVNFSNCEEPEMPYASKILFDLKIEQFYEKQIGKKLMRGNVTIKEDIINTNNEATIRWSLVREEGKKLNDKLKWHKKNHINCHSTITKIMLNVWGIPYVKKCLLKKGFYVFNNVDVELLARANIFQGRSMSPYGLYVIESEINDKKRSLGCWTTYVYVSPDKTNPGKLQ